MELPYQLHGTRKKKTGGSKNILGKFAKMGLPRFLF
jgi:hypothetical protein